MEERLVHIVVRPASLSEEILKSLGSRGDALRISRSESVSINGCIPLPTASSRPLWHRSWWVVLARAVAVCSRLCVRLSSRSTSSTAQLPEPMVNEANASFSWRRVSDVSLFSVSTVVSTSCRLPSLPTTSPARTCPSSIMLATWTMPLSRPKQALDTS